MMKLTDVMINRRSVRAFKQTPIEAGIIEDMLEAARLAPSAGNGQAHVFGVVDDPELKTALAQAAGGQMWIAEAPVIMACCARLEADLRDLPEEDFGLAVNRTRFGRPFLDYLNRYPDRKSVGTLFANAAPLIPAEHMFLTAVSHGLAACFVGYLDVAEASRILSLPDDMVCLFLLPVGYPDEAPKEKSRRSLQEISFRNTYGIPVNTKQLQVEQAPPADSAGLRVRIACIQDVPALFDMNERFNGPGSTTKELLADAIRHNSQETVLIAAIDGAPAGFCCVQFMKSMCYSVCYAEITELFVKEECRRQGVASALMACAEEAFQGQQIGGYQLFTGKTNTVAQRFYEQSGYVPSEERMYRKRL